jgi:hypothetical protein
VTKGAGLRVVRTAAEARLTTSAYARFLGRESCERRDHIVVQGEPHAQRVLTEYALN